MDKEPLEHLKYTPFLQKHSDFHNIFYDSDFVEIRKTVNHLNDLLKNMTLRFDRKDTLTIAKSVFDYVTQKEMYVHYPHMYFDFRFDDTRICIGKKHIHGKNVYFVSVCGYSPTSSVVLSHASDIGFFANESLETVQSGFCEVVREFILTRLGALF